MAGGIKTKPRTEKEKLKARQAAFSDVDNARVARLKMQSANGFKGQVLNDHGLPAGGVEVNAPTDSQDGAKFRKQKYQDGTKSIKTKKGGMIDFIHGEDARVKNMSDKELEDALKKNMDYTTTKQNKVEENLLNETVKRKWKKQGGYATGTKSIKTKKMC